MTRLEILIFDTFANTVLKSLVGKAPERLNRALWSSYGKSCPALVAVT